MARRRNGRWIMIGTALVPPCISVRRLGVGGDVEYGVVRSFSPKDWVRTFASNSRAVDWPELADARVESVS